MPALAFVGTLIAGGYWLFGPTGQAPTATVTSQPPPTAGASKTGDPSQVAATTTRPPPPIAAPAETEAADTEPAATTEDQIPGPAETQAGGARTQPQSPPTPPRPPAADFRGPAPPSVAIAPEPPAAAPIASGQVMAPPAISEPAGKSDIVLVQLASMTTEAGANAEWQRLQTRIPDLLGSRQPDISKDEQRGRTWWRLRTGGFEQAAQATEFCGRLRAKGLSCFVTPADQTEAERAKNAR